MRESRSILSMRANWSSIRALVGPTYSAPTHSGGFSKSEDTTGMSAASVFPDDVPEEISRWSSVSNRTSKALSCMSRKEVHPLLCRWSRTKPGIRPVRSVIPPGPR